MAIKLCALMVASLMAVLTLIGLMHSRQETVDAQTRQKIEQNYILTNLLLDYVVEMQKKGVLPKGGDE